MGEVDISLDAFETLARGNARLSALALLQFLDHARGIIT